MLIEPAPASKYGSVQMPGKLGERMLGGFFNSSSNSFLGTVNQVAPASE
jgi:hypothetical protein